MKFQLVKNPAIRTVFAIGMTLALGFPALAQPAEPAKPGKMAMGHAKMNHSKMLMDRCQGMMDDMKAQDSELTARIAEMNAASRESKVDLMAAIITQMAQQRAAMNARVASMHMEMMKHMQMGMGSAPHHAKMKGLEKDSEAANQ